MSECVVDWWWTLAGDRDPVDNGDCDPGVPGGSGAAVFPCDFFITERDIIGWISTTGGV